MRINVWLLLGLCLAIVAVFAWATREVCRNSTAGPGADGDLSRLPDDARHCAGNLYQIGFLTEIYAAEHGGALPPPERWVDALTEANGGVMIPCHCPADSSEGRCSYGMNAALKGLSLTEVRAMKHVVLFYETAHPGDNPHGGPEDVADPPRHRGGNFYQYGWYVPKQEKRVPSFAPTAARASGDAPARPRASR